jgi:PAS domain S-box-containing protein
VTSIRGTSTFRDYGVAVAAVAVAIGFRAALTPLMGSAFPLATMFSAVAFCSYYSSWRPALFTVVFGYLAADLAFIPGASLLFGRPLIPEVSGIGVYLLSCGSIIVLGEAMRNAQRGLQAERQALAAANLALEGKMEAHGLLAAIVASTGDAVISTTLSSTITSWNNGAEQLFGYSASEAIGRDVFMLIPAERRDEEEQILDRIRSDIRVSHFDTVRITKTGERRDVSLTVSPVHDRHGQVIGASKVARDITQRKLVEQQLLRREEEQRLLVAIHDATRGMQDPGLVMSAIVRHVGEHFSVSRCAYGEVDGEASTVLITRGYTDGLPTVAGRYPLQVFGEAMAEALGDGRTVIIDDVRSSALTDTPMAQATYARMRIVALVCVPLMRSDRLVAILVMCNSQPRAWVPAEAELLEQIAERTLFAVESARAAEALRESRDVLALAMSAGQMGAWSRDLLTDSVWWSPELEMIVGLSPGGFAGSRDGFLSIVHEDDREAVAGAIDSAVQSRTDYTIEFRFQHASGEWRWMEGRGKALYGPDGTPTMMYGLGMDITERRRAIEALQEADRRKDEFLATLAHELRNPLAPITSGLHILRSTGGHGEAAVKARAIMERQVAQMVRLVDDLLDVARITTGKTELRREPLDLADAVRDAIDTSRPLMTVGGQHLEIVRPPAPVLVNADRTRLAQVFANLLNNSAKYSGDGQSILIALEQQGNEAVVRVRDEGVGITRDSLSRIFDMFRQANDAGHRSPGGLGIGLFLVRRIVEMHGGRVEARSDGPGCGSEFEVRIPALPVARGLLTETAKADTQTPGVGRRILVVDDNADAAALLSTTLSIAGHDTRLAHDGPEAMQTAADYRPDVIFLDIGMPTLDGYETARWIREQPWGKDTVLIALTGWGQSEDRRKSAAAGFDHHLVKPADPLEIAALIASLAPPPGPPAMPPPSGRLRERIEQ